METMNISILLMEQIAQLFLMIFMGFLIVKMKLVRDDDSKVLSKIILYLIRYAVCHIRRDINKYKSNKDKQ